MLTPEERALAIDAVRGAGLEVGGADIVRRARGGPLVIEVNPSPGLSYSADWAVARRAVAVGRASRSGTPLPAGAAAA